MSDSGWYSPGFVDSGCWSFKLRKSWEWKLDWFAQNGFKLGENLVNSADDRTHMFRRCFFADTFTGDRHAASPTKRCNQRLPKRTRQPVAHHSL